MPLHYLEVYALAVAMAMSNRPIPVRQLARSLNLDPEAVAATILYLKQQCGMSLLVVLGDEPLVSVLPQAWLRWKATCRELAEQKGWSSYATINRRLSA